MVSDSCEKRVSPPLPISFAFSRISSAPITIAFDRLPEEEPAGELAGRTIDATEFDTEGVATSRTYTSPGYDEAPTRLDIDMSVVFGSGRVR